MQDSRPPAPDSVVYWERMLALRCPGSNPASAIGYMGSVGPHFTVRCWCKELNMMAMLGVASGLRAAFMQRSADCCPVSGGIPALLWGQQGFGDV